MGKVVGTVGATPPASVLLRGDGLTCSPKVTPEKSKLKVASNSRATSRGALGQTAALQGRSVMSGLARRQELIARVEG